MPPFRHAMRLINGEEGDLPLRQEIAKVRGRGTFWRDIEQVEIARTKAGHRLCPIIIRRGERGCANAHRIGGAHLILHQGDERGDDNACPGPHHRRQLIA